MLNLIYQKSKEGFDMTLNLHNSESLVIIYGNEQRLRWRKAFRIKRQSWCSW